MGTDSLDLNTQIIAAVNTKIQASILEAMAGDEFLGQFVIAALNERVEVDRYDRKKDSTFLHQTLKNSIQEATKAAVQELVDLEREQISQMVQEAIVKQLPSLADQLVNSLRSSAYAVTVHIQEQG